MPLALRRDDQPAEFTEGSVADEVVQVLPHCPVTRRVPAVDGRGSRGVAQQVVITVRLSEVGSVVSGTYGGFSLAFLAGWSRGRGDR